jgi:HEAT repeat protein
MLQPEIIVDELQRLRAANDPQSLGNYILQHYQQLLEQRPQQLIELLPPCLMALASVNHTESLVTGLLQKVMTEDADYSELFLLDLRLRAFNTVLPQMAENRILRPYLDLIAYQLWEQLKKNKNVGFSLLTKSFHILSTPAMLGLLAKQILEPTQLLLAVECLQKITTPEILSLQINSSTSLTTDKTLDRLFSGLLSVYGKTNDTKICITVAHLIQQGIKPREQLRKKWIEKLTRDVREGFASADILSIMHTLVLLPTATQPLPADDIATLVNKLFVFIQQGFDLRSVVQVLRAFITNNATTCLPPVFAAYSQKTITLQVLCKACGDLSSTAVTKHLALLTPLISTAIASKTLAESAPALLLLQQHEHLLTNVITAIEGKGSWTTMSLVLLQHALGYQNVDNLLLEQATRNQLIHRPLKAVASKTTLKEIAPSPVKALYLTPLMRIQCWQSLLPKLQHDDWHISNPALYDLIELGRTPELKSRLWQLLISLLRNKSRSFQTAAIHGLMQIADSLEQKSELWSLLLPMSQDKDENVKLAVYENLFHLACTFEQQSQLRTLFIPMLHDQNVMIRRIATRDLIKLITSPEQKMQLRTLLIPKLQDEDSTVRKYAVHGLIKLASTPEHKNQLWSLLKLMLSNSNQLASITALYGLTLLTSTPEQEAELWPLLTKRLKYENKEVRDTAAEGLSNLLMHTRQQKAMSQRLTPAVLTDAPQLFQFLKLREARTFLSKLANEQLQEALEQLNSLNFDFTQCFTTPDPQSTRLSLDAIRQLTIPEVLIQLKTSQSLSSALPLVKVLYEYGLHSPGTTLFHAALEQPALLVEHRHALVDFLLSVNIAGIKLAPAQILRLVLPVYLNKDTTPELCLRIEQLLSDHTITQLPAQFLEICLRRTQGGERVTNELLANAEFHDYLITLIKQLHRANDVEKHATTQALFAVPLSHLIQSAATLGDDRQLSADLNTITLNKMTALGNGLKSELHKMSLPILLSYFELLEQDARFASQRSLFLDIMQRKLDEEPWPVRNNLLITDTPCRIPPELQMDLSAGQASRIPSPR